MDLPPLFVIDTGPLLDCTVAAYQDSPRRRWPGAVEIQGHVRRAEQRLEAPDGERFLGQVWDPVSREILEWRLEERPSQFADMAVADLVEAGPVDLSLLQIAKAATRERASPCTTCSSTWPAG